MARKLLGDYIDRDDIKITASARSTKVMSQDGKLIAIVRGTTKFTDLLPRTKFDAVQNLHTVFGKINPGITSELIQDADGKFYHMKKDKTLETVESYAKTISAPATSSRGIGSSKTVGTGK